MSWLPAHRLPHRAGPRPRPDSGRGAKRMRAGRKEKSEIRNPKSEGNPKTETRQPVVELRIGRKERKDHRELPKAFGFRFSDFLRISDFGFRISSCLPPSPFGLPTSYAPHALHIPIASKPFDRFSQGRFGRGLWQPELADGLGRVEEHRVPGHPHAGQRRPGRFAGEA